MDNFDLRKYLQNNKLLNEIKINDPNDPTKFLNLDILKKDILDSGKENFNKKDFTRIFKFLNEWPKGKVSVEEWLKKHGEYWNEFVQDNGDSDDIFYILKDLYKLNPIQIKKIMKIYWGDNNPEFR